MPLQSTSKLLALSGLLAATAGCTPWSCDSTSCSDGCCTGDGVCVVQTLDDSNYDCGLGGQQCTSCDYKHACVAGVCQAEACSSKNCTGCCSNNVCVTGITTSQCGTNGAACDNCQSKGLTCNPNSDYTGG